MNSEMEAAARNAQTIITWIFAFQAVWLIGFTVNFMCAAVAAIHAAKRDRTAWTLVIIFFPFIGWIAYWIRNEGAPGSQVEYVKPGTIGPAGQMGRTEHDVANEVSAQISDEIRRRRLERGR
jgi:hypothetical protein